MTDKLNRYEGALLGVAIGDALGAPLEFMRAEEIKKAYGTVRDMQGGGWLNVIPGEVTDDTQMTIAVAEGIRANPDDPLGEIGKRFVEWYNTDPKDIGSTCRAVISKAAKHPEDGAYWRHIASDLFDQTNGKTAGNGALMRTIYPALYYKHPAKIAKSIGAMTHCHLDSDIAIHGYVTAISEIIEAPNDIDVGWAKERVEFRMMMNRAMLMGKTPKPSGYVVESAVCAMDAIHNTNNFEDALIYAVNLGGDTDTIGAITGGLAGAIYGSKEIPLRWLNRLANARNNALFGEPESKSNLLAMWCANMAHKAYDHRERKKNAA